MLSFQKSLTVIIENIWLSLSSVSNVDSFLTILRLKKKFYQNSYLAVIIKAKKFAQILIIDLRDISRIEQNHILNLLLRISHLIFLGRH